MSHVSIIRPRHLVWLPAALLVSAGLLSAFGVSLTPNGRAATATGTTTISATVLPEVSLDLGQNAAGAAACSAGAGTISGAANAETAQFGTAGTRLAINASGATALGTCNMTFGTNNGASGASIAYKSARVVTANRTFCRSIAVNADCNSAAGTFYSDDDGANATLEADKFGVRIDTGTTCDTQSLTDNFYYGAPRSTDAATTICTGELANATAAQDGVVELSFHVNTSAAITSGDYNAELVFTATAN